MITESIASMIAASRAKVMNVPVAKIITVSTEKKATLTVVLLY